MDNINIESVAGNSNLADWASEDTQQLLLRVALDNKKIQKQQLTSINEILKLLKKQSKIKNKGGSGSGNNDSSDRNQNKKKKDQDDSIIRNTDANKDNTKAVSLTTSALGAMAFAAGALTKLFTDTYGTYNNLIKYGAIVDAQAGEMTGNMGDLGVLMKSSGATLESLERAIVASSRAIKMYGTKAFADTIGQVSEQLYKFGFTNSESADFIAKDLESRRRAGLIGRLSDIQYHQSVVQGTKNLMRFSKILGENWESLQANADATIAGAASFQLWIRTLDPKSAERAKQSMDNVSMLFGQELGRQMADMAALDSGAIGTDKLYMSLVKGGAQDVADMMFAVSRKIRAGTLNTDSAFEELGKIAKQASNFGVINQDMLRIMTNALGEDTAEKLTAELSLLADAAENATAENQALANASNQYQETMKRLQSQFDKMFISFKGSWIKGLEEVIKSPETQAALETLFTKISGIFDSKNFQGLITGLLAALTQGVEWITKKINELVRVDEEGKSGIDRALETATTFFKTELPNMITSLTNMSSKIIGLIDRIQKDGFQSIMFGDPKYDTGTKVVTPRNIRESMYGRSAYDTVKENASNSPELRKILSEAEKTWSDPLYKSILAKQDEIPAALAETDRLIVELARENVKDREFTKMMQSTFSKMPSISELAAQYKNVATPTTVTKLKPSAVESYSAKSITSPTEAKQTVSDSSAVVNTVDPQTVTTPPAIDNTTSANTNVNQEQDKIQPLVYTLDMLAGNLQNLEAVPQLLASINSILTSMKNGQSLRTA